MNVAIVHEEPSVQSLPEQIMRKFALFKSTTARLPLLNGKAQLRVQEMRKLQKDLRAVLDQPSLDRALLESVYEELALRVKDAEIFADSVENHSDISDDFINDAEVLVKRVVTFFDAPPPKTKLN